MNPALSEGLPPFLAPGAGLNSGFMMPQVTAAALVSENKVLAHPASVDSITTSGNKEDYVSMGMTRVAEAEAGCREHAQRDGDRSHGSGAGSGFSGAAQDFETRSGGACGDSGGVSRRWTRIG